MITRDVREWLDRVKRNEYSYEDAMQEFMNFTKFLTIEEIKLIKAKIEDAYNSK